MYKYQINKEDIKLVQIAINLLNNLNVPISRNVTFRNCEGFSRFGYCAEEDNGSFNVYLNSNLINDEDKINTIIHELLHTIDNPNYTAHKGEWAKWAKFVSNNSKYKISVTNEKKLKKIKYTVVGKYGDKFEIKQRTIHTFYVTCFALNMFCEIMNKKEIDKLLYEYVTTGKYNKKGSKYYRLNNLQELLHTKYINYIKNPSPLLLNEIREIIKNAKKVAGDPSCLKYSFLYDYVYNDEKYLLFKKEIFNTIFKLC